MYRRSWIDEQTRGRNCFLYTRDVGMRGRRDRVSNQLSAVKSLDGAIRGYLGLSGIISQAGGWWTTCGKQRSGALNLEAPGRTNICIRNASALHALYLSPCQADNAQTILRCQLPAGKYWCLSLPPRSTRRASQTAVLLCARGLEKCVAVLKTQAPNEGYGSC